MQIEAFDLENVTVLVIQDRRIIATNTGNLRAALLSPLHENKGLLLDFGNVEFIDSVGLAAVVNCLRAARAQGREIKLCRTSRHVQSLLELVNLHKLFDVFGSLEEALQSYSEPNLNYDSLPALAAREFASVAC